MTEQRTFGQRAADAAVAGIGSWAFLITQTIVIILWVAFNSWRGWPDKFPFILLNLGLSLQAAVAAPMILLSGNRQAAKDRAEAHADYETNVKAEAEIATEETQITAIAEAEARLSARLDTLKDELVLALIAELNRETV